MKVLRGVENGGELFTHGISPLSKRQNMTSIPQGAGKRKGRTAGKSTGRLHKICGARRREIAEKPRKKRGKPAKRWERAPARSGVFFLFCAGRYDILTKRETKGGAPPWREAGVGGTGTAGRMIGQSRTARRRRLRWRELSGGSFAPRVVERQGALWVFPQCPLLLQLHGEAGQGPGRGGEGLAGELIGKRLPAWSRYWTRRKQGQAGLLVDPAGLPAGEGVPGAVSACKRPDRGARP